MKTQPNDGGPAFPSEQGHCPDGTWNQTFDPGMSLRDYMIIHAPVSEIEALIPDTVGEISQWLGVKNYTWIEHYPMALAKARMIWADAMIAARERKEGDQ
jgi:hypothetical protein